MRPQLRTFCAGLGWGGWWIGELTAYPGWEFFALAALLTGVGDLIAGRIPARPRAAVEFLLLTATAFAPVGWPRTLILPLTFGVALGGSLREAEDQWRASRQLCSGLLLGAMLTLIPAVPRSVFFICLLGAEVLEFAGRGQRFAAALAGTAAVYLLPAAPPPPSPPPPGALLCALAEVPTPAPPRTVVIGGERGAVAVSVKELLPAVRLRHLTSVPFRRGTAADLIVAVELPRLADGGVRTLADDLVPGGVLVLPRAAAAFLPGWEWHVLPGTAGKYLIAGKGRALDLSPDRLDARLQRRFAFDVPERPLAGALAGMLAGQTDRVVRVAPGGFPRRLWPGACAAAALILTFGGLGQAKSAPPGDRFRLFLNCGGTAMLTAECLPRLMANLGGVPGIAPLAFALGTIWFFRRPAPARGRAALILGVLGVAALPLNGAVWPAVAMLGNGYAFAALDSELRSRIPPPAEPLRFLAIAAGIAAVALAHTCAVPPVGVLCLIALCRIYSLCRG